ncbi:MAG: phosphopantetheine-binding protein [Firmicutes bacterium]|nr:phosphopantetheine-binding protein [Bacillota bacterium]
MDIKSALYEVLTEYKGKEVAADEATTFDELDFDSLDKVDLLMQIEEKFNITFGDDLQVDTVGGLIEKIKELKK